MHTDGKWAVTAGESLVLERASFAQNKSWWGNRQSKTPRQHIEYFLWNIEINNRFFTPFRLSERAGAL